VPLVAALGAVLVSAFGVRSGKGRAVAEREPSAELTNVR
jgi:hypothetical protein